MKIKAKLETKVTLSDKNKKKMDRLLKKFMKAMQKQKFSNHVCLCFIRGEEGGKGDWVNGYARDLENKDYIYNTCIWG